MFLSSDRSTLRRFFVVAWRKMLEGAPLEPLEDMVARIVDEHPQYHSLLGDDVAVDKNFTVSEGRANPFLHLSMHVAIQEQVSTNRPDGIRTLYADLLRRFDDAHGLEHAMMECLGKSLWQAQQSGSLPDEHANLACVRALKRRRHA